ncbi:VCBS repeat-containing protein [Snuella lapsa]|uniref:VCBS repeat-containing protein n=1 Tax=Snuella lapsa TaxID=870481 RepID=A0ABP6X626_9FLAO
MKEMIGNTVQFRLIILLLLFVSFACYSQNQKRFTLLKSSHTGVKFSNDITSTRDKNIFLYANFYSGAGVGVGDFNNDGLQDIYFAGNMVPDKLYFNQGNLTFKDVTNEAGIEDDGGWSAGVTVADVNNDGFLDIYVSRELYDYNPEKRTNLLYINQGNGTFVESAKAYGLDNSQRTRHSVFMDYNKDGFLDVFMLINPPNAGILSEYFGSNKLKVESHVRLYKNTGKNYFVDVTEEAGLKYSGYPNAVSASDLNNDGWTDLYVTNDFQEPDFLFVNNKNGTFTNVIDTSMNHISNFGMGVDIADINNDGLLDVFVVDMSAEDNFRLKSNMSGMNPEAFWKVVNKGGHYQYMYNTLQLNNGNMVFSDVAQLTGMASTDWSWSNLIADYDNDGLKDVYVTNGLLHDVRNTDADKAAADFIDKTSYEWLKLHPDGGGITSIFDILDLDKVVNMAPSQPLSNYIFKNNGNLDFSKVMTEWGLDEKSFSNGAAYVDLDNDGDLDMVVNNVNSKAFIYRNNSETFSNANFIRINLFDSEHKSVFGARVTLYNDKQIQVMESTNVRGIYSACEPLVHFGIGNRESVDSIVVAWPNQKKTMLKDVKANQLLKLDMKDALVVNKGDANSEKDRILKDVTQSFSIKYRHRENSFDDYKYQVLLPHKMSQFGPAMDVADVNNDGLDDLFIGGAKGFSAVLYIQEENGEFYLSSEALWDMEKEYEDIDALFVDVNGDNYKDLYVVSGGNAYPKAHANYFDRVYFNDGKGNFSKGMLLNEATGSGSKVIAEDYDKDGDLDFFVGSRHVPREYPTPASSVLLENEGGDLVNKTNSLAPILNDIGMVTDAVWADFDGDNDSDLIIVGEWMPVTVLRNDDGVFSKVSVDGLDNSTGWWFSIEKGDFDNDGDIDFVAGNLGLNYKYKTSKERPFDIYYSDFDENGTNDLVLGYYDKDKHYPLRGFSCSSQQIPELKKKFKKYDVFASLEIDDVYGKGNLNEALHYKANTFASSYIENLGNSRFKMSPLPIQAQFSNINDILVKDIDNDNNLDVVVAENLYVSEIETPRNDAGIGLVMLGDGKGGFKSIKPRKSGFVISSDAKQIETIEIGNEEFVLVGNNDAKLQVFKVLN